MANNVLNKGAMESISRIEVEMPHLVDAIKSLGSKQDDMNAAVNRMSTRQEQFAGKFDQLDEKFKSIEKAIEEIPQKCPHREAIARCSDAVDDLRDVKQDQKDTSAEITSMKEDISSLKTSDKIYGGGTALFTVIFNALMEFLKAPGSS